MELGEAGDGGVGLGTVEVGVVGDVGGFGRVVFEVPPAVLIDVAGLVAGGGDLLFAGFELGDFGVAATDGVGVEGVVGEAEVGFGPGGGIGEDVVEELAGVEGVVAVGFEELREGDGVGGVVERKSVWRFQTWRVSGRRPVSMLAREGLQRACWQ